MSNFTDETLRNGQMFYKAKKNKSYVSKLSHAFRCAFDSAKFKVWIFFACLIFFFQFFMNLLVKIYKKRYDRHNGTLWTTDFFNSCVLSCILFIQKSSSIFQSCGRLKSDTFAAQKKKKNVKKTTFRLGLPICHELWDIPFIFFSLI